MVVYRIITQLRFIRIKSKYLCSGPHLRLNWGWTNNYKFTSSVRVLLLLAGLRGWIIVVTLQSRLQYNYLWYISSVAYAIKGIYIADVWIIYLNISWRSVVPTNSVDYCSDLLPDVLFLVPLNPNSQAAKQPNFIIITRYSFSLSHTPML